MFLLIDRDSLELSLIIVDNTPPTNLSKKYNTPVFGNLNTLVNCSQIKPHQYLFVRTAQQISRLNALISSLTFYGVIIFPNMVEVNNIDKCREYKGQYALIPIDAQFEKTFDTFITTQYDPNITNKNKLILSISTTSGIRSEVIDQLSRKIKVKETGVQIVQEVTQTRNKIMPIITDDITIDTLPSTYDTTFSVITSHLIDKHNVIVQNDNSVYTYPYYEHSNCHQCVYYDKCSSLFTTEYDPINSQLTFADRTFNWIRTTIFNDDDSLMCPSFNNIDNCSIHSTTSKISKTSTNSTTSKHSYTSTKTTLTSASLNSDKLLHQNDVDLNNHQNQENATDNLYQKYSSPLLVYNAIPKSKLVAPSFSIDDQINNGNNNDRINEREASLINSPQLAANNLTQVHKSFLTTASEFNYTAVKAHMPLTSVPQVPTPTQIKSISSVHQALIIPTSVSKEIFQLPLWCYVKMYKGRYVLVRSIFNNDYTLPKWDMLVRDVDILIQEKFPMPYETYLRIVFDGAPSSIVIESIL